MTDAPTLPPEVAGILHDMRAEFRNRRESECDVDEIEAAFCRLAEENALMAREGNRLHKLACEQLRRAQKAESERDALKARFAEAPVQVRPIPPTPEGLVGARFAMVKLEDGE